MSEPNASVSVPPQVDHPEVAEAVRLLGDLDEQPLEVHHERLSRVHEVLHSVLQPADPPR